MRKKELTNIAVIRELEKLFCDNITVHQKLKIIELYLDTTTEQEFRKKYNNFLEKDGLKCEHLKPSRIQTIIKSFEENSNNAGYVQPVGKNLFLKKFLQKYPSPRHVHFGEENWTIDLLTEYIKIKYACTITSDTIRKALTLQNKLFKKISTSSKIEDLATFSDLDGLEDLADEETPAELHYKKSLLSYIQNKALTGTVYFYQLYFTSFPLRKSTSITHNNRKSSFVGCIYGKSPDGKSILYRAKPYFQISSNYATHMPNLEYFFNLPIKPGIILIEDTYDSRKIIKNYYYWYFTEKKEVPKHQIYFLPNDIYSSLPLLKEFDTIAFLTRQPLLNLGMDGIKALKELSAINEIDSFFWHRIIRTKDDDFYKIPKLLKKI